MGVQFWQEFSNCVIRLIYQWDMKKCEETNFSMFASWHTGVPLPPAGVAVPAKAQTAGSIP